MSVLLCVFFLSRCIQNDWNMILWTHQHIFRCDEWIPVSSCEDVLYSRCTVHVFRYDSTTGNFTVPPGGGGLYYFSTYLFVDNGEQGVSNIWVNGEILCTATGDGDNGNDYQQATCSGLVQLAEGNLFWEWQTLYITSSPLANKKAVPYPRSSIMTSPRKNHQKLQGQSILGI